MCKVSTGFFLPMIIQQLSFPFFAMPLGGGGGEQNKIKNKQSQFDGYTGPVFSTWRNETVFFRACCPSLFGPVSAA